MTSLAVAATSPRALPSSPSSPSSSSGMNRQGPGGSTVGPAPTSSVVSAGEGTSYTHPSTERSVVTGGTSGGGRSVITSVSSLSDFSCGQLRHTLRCEMLPAEATDERFLLYNKYQVSVHGDNPETLTIRGFHRFLVESPIAGMSLPLPSPSLSPLSLSPCPLFFASPLSLSPFPLLNPILTLS